MIIGVLVIICILVGCVAALFGGLFFRQHWWVAVVAGILTSWLVHAGLGLTTDEYLAEELARVGLMALIPVTFVAWLSARASRNRFAERN